MSAENQFTGLPMPVFTAFGWAGEETAIQFALEQLETFIQQLHAALSPDARGVLPYAGLNNDTRKAFILPQRMMLYLIFISPFLRVL